MCPATRHRRILYEHLFTHGAWTVEIVFVCIVEPMRIWASLFIVLVGCTSGVESTDFSLVIDGLSAEHSREEALVAHRELVAGGKQVFPALLNRLDDKTVSHIEFQSSVVPFVPPPIGQVCFDILRFQIEGRWPIGFRDHRVLNRTNISQWIEEHSSQSLIEMRIDVLTQAIRNLELQVGTELGPSQATMLLDFLHEKMSLVEEPEFVLGKSVKNPFE